MDIRISLLSSELSLALRLIAGLSALSSSHNADDSDHNGIIVFPKPIVANYHRVELPSFVPIIRLIPSPGQNSPKLEKRHILPCLANNLNSCHLRTKHQDHGCGGAELSPHEGQEVFYVRPAVWKNQDTESKY